MWLWRAQPDVVSHLAAGCGRRFLRFTRFVNTEKKPCSSNWTVWTAVLFACPFFASTDPSSPSSSPENELEPGYELRPGAGTMLHKDVREVDRWRGAAERCRRCETR